MKLGVIADIHANLPALEAVLARLEAEKCLKIICLGDVVGYGPHPAACVDLVRERKLPCIQGNHDDWAAVPKMHWEVSDDVRHSISWTRSQLADDQLTWLRELPKSLHYAGIDFVHASNATSMQWPYVRDLRSLARNFVSQTCPLCFCGHTHQPAIGFDGDEGAAFLELQETVSLPHGHKLLINPGSVGQPRDSDPRAACVVYDAPARSVSFLRVAYDFAQTQAAMAAAELPERFIERLGEGT